MHLYLCFYVCSLLLNLDVLTKHSVLIRYHPFMTSTRRGRGGRAQVDESGRDWTSTQNIKIRAHWRHSVFSCKEVGVFVTRTSSLDGI